MAGAALAISEERKMAIGAQVTTWGFPGGYYGRVPLLSVGYLSGIEGVLTRTGGRVNRWVVNAAFNTGNSGGPLLDIETGSVVGVVSSKLAPIPLQISSALEALSAQKSGFRYTAKASDGTSKQFSEGQVIAEVLNHLRSQVQLVVGYAATLSDLRSILEDQGFEP